MEKQELDQLVIEVGKQTAEKMNTLMTSYETKSKEIAEKAIKDGGVTKEDFDAYQESVKATQEELKNIAKQQGIDLNALSEKMQGNPGAHKSIAQVLETAKAEMSEIYGKRSGVKSFMVSQNSKGEYIMRPYDDTNRKLGPEATIAGISGGTAAVTQAVDAASILRMGANAPIISQYRNTPWIFDLANLINADISQSFASYWEEIPKTGGSAIVPEGGTKPPSFYSYNLVTKPYKKAATIIGVTEEFAMDFPRLESDILGKGRLDVMNDMNTSILTNVITNATAYNTNASFGFVYDAQDFDVIAAMAAQVDNATFGNVANVAIMSTFKKYHMGVLKSTQGEYLNRPDVLSNINFVGNPSMAADDVIVGDLKNYNIILRGGFIVKVGYNGTDFAENRFSIVMEQYYFDYISDIRKVGIVKGPSFGHVAALIDTPNISSQ